MKRKQLYIALALMLIISLSFGFTANAGNGIKIVVNDKVVPEEAKIIDGKVYIPIDTVSGKLGAQVSLSKDSKTVHIKNREQEIPEIVSKVGPSVVGIMGKLKRSSPHYNPNTDNIVFGTGVIYKENGYIITNAHVVKDMDTIVVVLSNSKAYKARLKAMDERFDLAMIKIDKGGLTPAVFGSMSDVMVGETVIAIGTPLSFSLRNSATKGIISGINRSVEGEYKFIQSDAAINGGNSGGPLVNMRGEVIGINSVKFTGFGVEGLSFSIPVDTVKYVIGHFERYGKVKRPFLGVAFSEGVASRYGLPSTDEGLTITDIEEESPAEEAGLEIDDMLKEINGVKVSTLIDYNEELKKYLPGDTVELKIQRDEDIITIEITFDESK